MIEFATWAWGFVVGVIATLGSIFLCSIDASCARRDNRYTGHGYQPTGGGRPPSNPPSGGTLGRKPSIK